MAPILQDTSKKIQRVPAYVLKQVETRAKQLYTAPMKALDSIPKGISELTEVFGCLVIYCGGCAIQIEERLGYFDEAPAPVAAK